MPVFTYDGMYTVIKEEDKKAQQAYLGVTVFFVMVILFYQFWPVWMKIGFWYFLFYYICGYFIMIGVRVLLWVAFYHIGVDLWLFPKYFDSYYNPKKFLLPVVSVRKRPDCFSPSSIVFRAISGFLIFYICR